MFWQKELTLVLVLGLLAVADKAEGSQGVIPAESGFIGIGAGTRILPHTSLSSRAAGSDLDFTHSMLQPGALLSLGYKVDPRWAVLLEFSGGGDKVVFNQRQVDLLSLSLQLSGNFILPIGPDWLEPWLGAGVGYWLSTIREKAPERSSEGTVFGLMAGGGVRFGLSPRLGLLADFRWIWARQPTQALGTLTTGGGLASIGLLVVFPHSGHQRR